MKGFDFFCFLFFVSFLKALLSTVAKRKKKLLPSLYITNIYIRFLVYNKKIHCPAYTCVSSVAYQMQNPLLLSRTWCEIFRTLRYRSSKPVWPHEVQCFSNWYSAVYIIFYTPLWETSTLLMQLHFSFTWSSVLNREQVIWRKIILLVSFLLPDGEQMSDLTCLTKLPLCS